MLRYRLITVGIVVVIFAIIGALGSGVAKMRSTTTQAYDRANLIRFHVIGNSNSDQDQALKLKVRDRIIKITEPLLLKVQDPGQAGIILTNNMAKIRAAVEDELLRNGQKMPVQICFKQEMFPERVYPFGVLPAGKYQGLLVKLGEAKGKNWWCILYPPLCLLNPEAPDFRDAKNEPVKVEYRLMALEKLMKSKGLTMDRFWAGWAKYLGIM